MASNYVNLGPSGGGGAPSGAATGDLTGSTYPAPVVSALSLATWIPVTAGFSWGTNLPTTGTLRYGNTQAGMVWRNAANSANIVGIGGVDASNILWFGTTQAGGSRPDITFIDAATSVNLGVNGSSKIVAAASSFSLGYSAAATATAGAGTLPLTPEDFLPVTVNGTARKIPLYNV